MTRTPIALPVGDVSTFAKSLRKQIETHDGAPTHVELLNMLARSAGYRNFQQLRAHAPAEAPVGGAAPLAAPQADAALVARVFGHFDDAGRLIRWPSRRSHQILALWAIWSMFPAGVSLDDAAVKGFLADRHSFGDHALLRRELVDMGLLVRTPDGRDYRRIERQPPPDALALIRQLSARIAAV
ncbi:DUF2087 domain-containing protein [Kaistia geumhonensis]|uniref:DUF2087 domain-containing protein n=1 Tax=Kaistia geumhonensis TaxID=410839 RepID=A0ABU0MAP1_9HYPH|nr:DUF2087 domain-containing protein [Kaistia geumhonensis]MCX5480941.1 DUF2087 domain-containing protein [Kaistia geumhonensis]MDQ0517998.1 hypothetical protein [Kaistia geumhonensis]